MFVRSPDSVYTACTSMPGWSSGTRNIVRPACFGPSRLRAGEEEDVVGDVGVRREHLLPVDDPPVAVPASAGAHAGDVGPDLRLGHPEGDGDLAPQEPGQDLGLELVGADRADDAGHHLGRADGDDRRLGLRQLVVDDVDLEGVERWRSVLPVPGRHRPTVARPAGG